MITILTRKVSVQSFLWKSLRNLLRFLRTFVKTGIIDFTIFQYYGHTAVTRSLVMGLKELGIEFNLNPLFAKHVGETVFTLSDVGALKQAIEWKRSGKIKHLLGGPNLVEIPARSNDIISDPAIDVILVSSAMSVQIYETINPKLKGRVVSWYAGVDTHFWKPKDVEKGKDVLVYWKNAPKAFSIETENILKNNDYNIHRVVYGNYSRRMFKKLLNRCQFAVFLSITETQGIALAESWSMNVPTIVWDPQIEHYYLRNVPTTASPYLTTETGVRWKEFGDLEALLKTIDLSTFSPRQWTCTNMSDKTSAELFIKICSTLN
jgi:hypothetical protein